MDELVNVYQFTCIKTVSINPADISQTQQTKEIIYGRGKSIIDAVANFNEATKGQRIEVAGVVIVGSLSF